MRNDKHDLELQVAAVKLWYDGRDEERTQDDVAERLRAMYPLHRQFDKYRVNRLCHYAVENGLPDRPAPAKLKNCRPMRRS